MKAFVLPPIALLALLIAGLVPTTASAASPHFINSSASLQGVNLQIQWKEAGLGNNVTVHYVASANASATYACINNGGHNPSAANKQTFSGPVSASGDFSSGQNGQITGQSIVGPPPATGFSCPGGQHLVLAKVTYTGISLQDTSNGIVAPIAGTVCGSFVNLPEFAC